MERARFFELMTNPEYVRLSDLDELEKIVSDYPYFQAARLLAAKSIKNTDLIQSAAVHSANRSVLMRIINGKYDPEHTLPNLGNLDVDSGGINAFAQLDDISEVTAPAFTFGDREPLFPEESNNERDWLENTTDETVEQVQDQYSTIDFGEKEDISSLLTDVDADAPVWGELVTEEQVMEPEQQDTDLSHPTDKDEHSLIDDDFRKELMDSLNNLQRTRDELMRQEPEFKETEIPEPTFEEPTYTVPAYEEPSAPEISDVVYEENHEISGQQDTQPAMDNTYPNLPNSSNENYFEQLGMELEKEGVEQPLLDPSLFDLNDLLMQGTSEEEEKKNDLPAENIRQQKLIEHFINNKPSIQRKQLAQVEGYSPLVQNLYEKSIRETPEVMTETIAKLMIKQGKPEKAIHIYEQLSLSNPDKTVYFASIIEKLKQEHTL